MNAPAQIGQLVTHRITVAGETYRIATLRSDDPVAPALLPDLYEPVLVGIALLGFQLRGFERVEATGGDFSVVQEWHCELP